MRFRPDLAALVLMSAALASACSDDTVSSTATTSTSNATSATGSTSSNTTSSNTTSSNSTSSNSTSSNSTSSNSTSNSTSGGTTGAMCSQGTIDCDGACIDPLVDTTHCGASGSCEGDEAGFTCAATETCLNGACLLDCGEGRVPCDGECIDPLAHDNYCGATADCLGDNAGVVCAFGTCQFGQCECLQFNQLQCDGECVDPQTNNNWCGATGTCLGDRAGATCRDDQSCVDGTCACRDRECDGACVLTQFDNAHCGDCGQPCTDQACVEGECTTVTFAGALPPTGAFWNYNNAIGPDGARLACDANFPGSRLCTSNMLEYAASLGELSSVADIDNNDVNSFWGYLASGGDSCDGWSHGSGDLGAGIQGSYHDVLNHDTGELGPMELGPCNATRAVGCCFVE